MENTTKYNNNRRSCDSAFRFLDYFLSNNFFNDLCYGQDSEERAEIVLKKCTRESNLHCYIAYMVGTIAAIVAV